MEETKQKKNKDKTTRLSNNLNHPKSIILQKVH